MHLVGWSMGVVSITKRAGLALVIAAAGASAAAPAAAQDAPRAVLLSSEPLPGAPEGASAHHIRYRSVGVNGAANEVTGVVILPDGPAPKEGRDVVAWAHGTSGVAKGCALSQSPALFGSIAGLRQLLAKGYAVVATDYAGLGTPGPHPYLAGDVSAYAILDSVRAAQEYGRGSISRRVVFWGESQGGHASLWAAQLAGRYAPELQVAGVAAAAPPTDLKANLTGGTNPLVRALMTAFTAASWSQAYDVPLSTVLGPVGQDVARRLARNCITLDPFSLRTKIGLVRFARALEKVDVSKSPPWAELLRRHSVQPAGLSVPTFIAQGSADPIVAPSVTRRFVQQLCRSRTVPVRYYQIEGGDHITVAKRSADATIRWFADRFAGKAAPDDCRP